jgi:hypothetical protein
MSFAQFQHTLVIRPAPLLFPDGAWTHGWKGVLPGQIQVSSPDAPKNFGHGRKANGASNARCPRRTGWGFQTENA